MTSSSRNIGAIVGGVAAGVVVVVVVVAFIWYLRRRRQSRSEADANAPPPGAQTQELPGSHYYAPSGIVSQMFYTFSPTTRIFGPRPSLNIPVKGPSPSGAPQTSTNSDHARSTTHPLLSATTTPGGILSDPEVHRGSGVDAPGLPPPSAQGPALAVPPSSSYNVEANRVQGPIPNDPVEEGVMSGRRRRRYP